MSEPNENDASNQQAIRIAGLIYKATEKLPLTVEEQQELEAWTNSGDGNSTLFESLRDRAAIATELEALKQYNEEEAVVAIFNGIGQQAPSAVVSRRLLVKRLAVAASLLVLAGIGCWYFMIQRNDQVPGLYNTLATANGEQQYLKLNDGTKIWLNAATTIRYPKAFDKDKREVTITGEAYFEVAKDSTRPFFVHAGGIDIRVIGTAFNVMAYADEEVINTSLVEGIIKASHKEQELLLKPGETASLDNRSGVMRMGRARPGETAGWRNGKFIFFETELPAIMRAIARWYNKRVEYRGTVANFRFNGPISRKNSLNDVLEILSATRKVHFQIPNDTTIVVIPGPG